MSERKNANIYKYMCDIIIILYYKNVYLYMKTE